jgi:hypothetical protein
MAAWWHRPVAAAPNRDQARARPDTSPRKAANHQERRLGFRERDERVRVRVGRHGPVRLHHFGLALVG